MNESQSVLRRLLLLANALSRSLDSLHAGYCISGTNVRILHYLYEHEGKDVFQRDIENAFDIRRSTVSKVVQLMEQKELISRQSVNGDARLKRIVLTDKARKILTSTGDELSRFEEHITSSLTPEEIQTLCTLLDKINRTLKPKD